MALSTLAAPAKRRRVAGKTSPLYLALLADVGPEDGDANQHVYLISVSRVLPGTVASAGFRDIATLSRAELRDMVRDAFGDPVPVASGGGRPPSGDSVVEIVIVAKEQHADGSDHFHVVVKLTSNRRFKQAKLTLRERYKLPSHWSCTHRHVWSALRHLHVATPKKPEVDKDLLVWTWDGRDLDLDEKSKEPFVANAWRKRRERMEAAPLVEGKKAPNFNKLDLTALIISKHLRTKASLLSCVQDSGSTAATLAATLEPSHAPRRQPGPACSHLEFGVAISQLLVSAKFDASACEIAQMQGTCLLGKSGARISRALLDNN